MRCFVCGIELKIIVYHHRCYEPEIIIEVCKYCHKNIHTKVELIHLDPIRFFKALWEHRIRYDTSDMHLILDGKKLLITLNDCQVMLNAFNEKKPHWNLCAFPNRSKS